MIRNSHINQIHYFRKIAGLLKEEDDFDTSDNPLDISRLEVYEDTLKDLYESILALEPIQEWKHNLVKVYPEYAGRIKDLENGDEELFEEIYDRLYNDIYKLDPFFFDED